MTLEAAGYHGPAIAPVVAQMHAAANNDTPLVICGGPGSGKKHAAKSIHLMSARAKAPYVIQSCIGFDDDTLRMELYGYRRGAFAWAIQDKAGLFDVAAYGTIVIDEIGALSLPMQAEILRVIENRTITTFGDAIPHTMNARIIATSAMPLAELVKHQKFRRDLYNALMPLTIPPLSERSEDLPELASFFLRRRCIQLKRPFQALPDDVSQQYRNYSWPGNVSELRREMERLAILAPENGSIHTGHISSYILEEIQNITQPTIAKPHGICVPDDLNIQDALIYVERTMIANALAQNDQNRTKTAEMLGISRRNLIRKIESLGIE